MRFCMMIKTIYLVLFVVFLLTACTLAVSENKTNETIVELWDVQSRVLHDPRANFLSIESTKNALKDYLLDCGISHSSLIAALYSVEAQSLLADNRTDNAIWAFKTALEMHPGYIAAARGLFAAEYKKSILSSIGTIGTLIKTYFNAYRDSWTQFITIGNFAFIFIAAALLSFIALIGTFISKYISLWVYEISSFISGKWRFHIGIFLIVVLMFLPLFMGFGLVWVLLLWLAWVYLYLERREKILIWCSWVLICCVIPANIIRVSAIKAYENPYIHAVNYSRLGGYSTRAIETIKLSQKQYPENPKPYFLLGVLNKRGGNYFDALKEYLEYRRLRPSDANGHINLGNIYFILNNLNEAISEYRRAESIDVKNAAIYYNLSKAYFHRFKFEQATAMLKKASELDPDLVTYYTDIHSTNPNRLLIDVQFPKSWFWEEIPDLFSSALADLENHWVKMGPGLNVEGAVISLVTITVILILFQIFL